MEFKKRKTIDTHIYLTSDIKRRLDNFANIHNSTKSEIVRFYLDQNLPDLKE